MIYKTQNLTPFSGVVTSNEENHMNILKHLRPKYRISLKEKYYLISLMSSIRYDSKQEKHEIFTRFGEIFNSEMNNISDKQSQTWFLICSFMLSCYEVMQKRKERELLISELSEALSKQGKQGVKWSIKLLLWFSKNIRKSLEYNSYHNAKERYGESFELDLVKDSKKFTTVVHKCGFHDFFLRRNAPELTKAMCQWDNNWADVINQSKRGVKFNRPQTISEGNKKCLFEFHFEK